jgi:hypothetical protein
MLEADDQLIYSFLDKLMFWGLKENHKFTSSYENK